MFELTGEIASRHEVYKVHPQLPVTLVMEAFNSCLFDGSAHPLNLTVGPRVVRLGQPVLDVVCFADHVEAHLPLPGGVTVARLLGKLDAPFDFAHDRIVGRDRMDPVWYRFQQVFKELPAVRLSALSTSWVTANLLVRSMSTNKFALRSLNFGDIHMEKPIG